MEDYVPKCNLHSVDLNLVLTVFWFNSIWIWFVSQFDWMLVCLDWKIWFENDWICPLLLPCWQCLQLPSFLPLMHLKAKPHWDPASGMPVLVVNLFVCFSNCQKKDVTLKQPLKYSKRILFPLSCALQLGLHEPFFLDFSHRSLHTFQWEAVYNLISWGTPFG